MIIRLDTSAAASPADQLVHQIIASIQSGELSNGDRLPTIRSLAGDLGVSPGTVARAYSELENDGWVVTKGRRGTTIAARPSSVSGQQLAHAALMLASAAVHSPDGVAEAHRALDVAFARLRTASP